MKMLPNFVDMAKSPEQIAEDSMPYDMQKHETNVYPYGLGICFGQQELDKLNLDGDCEPGDMVHLSCIARVTSVSKNETNEGMKTRIEMQIERIAVEGEEDVAEQPRQIGRVRRPY